MRQLTIFEWFGIQLPARDCYRLIRQAGFDGVLLWWDEVKHPDYKLRPALARKEGLWVENAHMPFDNANNLWLDNAAGDDYAAQMLRWVDECACFEIPVMVLHLALGWAPPPVNDKGMARLKRMVEHAENRGVRVALENLDTLGHLHHALDNIHSDALGFCFDAGHQNCRTPNDDLLPRHGNRLIALHLHDNDGFVTGAGPEDQHRLPFDGTINWPETMKKIKAAGYAGAIAQEALPTGHDDLLDKPEKFLELAHDRAARLRGMS